MIRRAPPKISLAAWATALVAALFFLLCVRGALDTGLSWDEDDHRAYGRWVLDWYASPDWTSPSKQVMSQYGALFGVACGALERLFPSTSYIALRHVATACFALVGLWFAARTARAIAGERAGFLAALVLAATPRWTGDAMFNPIDVPFAACTAVALYCLVRLVRELPSPPRSAWVKLGLASGAALGIRIGGILIFFYLAVSLALWILAAAIRRRGRSAAASEKIEVDLDRPRRSEQLDSIALARHARRFALGWIATVIVAYSVACAFWPYLLTNPIAHTQDIVRSSSSFPWKNTILFRGELVASTTPLRAYLPTWFAITLPPAFFVAAVIGAARWRARTTPCLARALASLALWLAVLFPVAYAIAVNATLYDGVRHFLFVIPAAAVLCGCALARWFESVRTRIGKLAVAVVLAASVAEPAWWYVRSHPYEYTYFNPFAGGLSSASHDYETDYWGLSLRSAAEWIRAHRSMLGAGEIVVATNSSWHLLAPWFHDASIREPRSRDEPVHVFVEHYRHRPPGWDLRGEAVFSLKIAGDQVPFYRIHLGPAAPAKH